LSPAANPLNGAAWVVAAVLCGSCSSALAASAEIVMLIGKGDRRSGDRGAWVPAAVSEKLDQGQFVRTLANSQMAIFLPDRTQIRLNQNSQLEVKTVAEAASLSETLLRLNAGRAWSQARPVLTGGDNRRRTTLETRTATLGIRGTDWEVEVDPEGRTQLVVFSGVVEMSNDFGAIVVSSGEAGVAEAGKAPAKRVLVNPKSRIQWVSSWRPRPRHWAAGDAGRFGEAVSRIETGDYSGAAAQLRPQAERDLVAALLLADLLLHEGQAADARAVLAAHLQAGADARAAVLTAYAMAQQDELPAARELLAAGLSGAPGNVRLLLAQGDLAILDGDAATARSAFAQVIAAQPDNAEAWHGLGVVESERENTRQARAALGESLKLQPGSGKSSAELAAAETFAGNLAIGRKLLLDLLAHEPDNYQALTALGLNRLKSGQPAEALESFMKAGVIEPRYSRAWLYSGVAFYQLGERERAVHAFRKASELDEHDPMPFLYTGIVEADALEYGAAIESARLSQRRMPFLRSLNQAASNQKGNANLGAALASFGMEEWAGHYAAEAYSPYWGGSHLFLADRYTGKFNKNSELFTGFLTDPMAFGASNRFSSLASAPGHYGRMDLFLDRSDWTQAATIGTFNGMRVEPTPIAYFLSGDLARADSRDDGSTARGRNFTLGLGAKPRDDINLFGFFTDSRLDATLKTASLTNDPLAQTESRADVGLNFRIAYENQLWFKVGGGRQDNDVSGFIVSQPTADALNQAFNTNSISATGTLDAFRSSIEQRDAQFRHAFTLDGVQWTWGAEHSTQERTGDLGMTFAPVRIDIRQRDSVRSTDAYLSGLYRASGRYDAQAGLSWQEATLHRQDYSALGLHDGAGGLLTLEDSAARERVSGWNPRVGVKWQLAPSQSLRAVVQKWRRPASAATLAPVDTVGVPVNDRLPAAGGLYERARIQFDAEIGAVSFAQAFADHERVDNGLAGRQSAITGFEVTQLESLRNRPEVFSPRADLEETPQFREGRVSSVGLAFNHLPSRRQALSARYLYRSGEQAGTGAGLAIPFISRHYLLLRSQWSLPGRWLLGTSAAWRGERFKDAANQERLAPGWSFGLTVYWEGADKRSSMQAIADNVLSRRDAAIQPDPHLVLRYSYSF
jgi:Flp pilus assembly protein TadD